MRPHCQNPDTCTAAKPTTHCRRCSIMRHRGDPVIEAKRVTNLRARYDDPAYVEAHRERLRVAIATARKRPEFMAWLREHGRRQYRDVLSRPDVVAKHQDPAVRKEAGRRASNTRLAWCPPELRDEYRFLIKTHHMPAVEARALIEEMIPGTAAHARRTVANEQFKGRLKDERQKAQAY